MGPLPCAIFGISQDDNIFAVRCVAKSPHLNVQNPHTRHAVHLLHVKCLHSVLAWPSNVWTSECPALQQGVDKHRRPIWAAPFLRQAGMASVVLVVPQGLVMLQAALDQPLVTSMSLGPRPQSLNTNPSLLGPHFILCCYAPDYNKCTASHA
jgi:hypothetical protein